MTTEEMIKQFFEAEEKATKGEWLPFAGWHVGDDIFTNKVDWPITARGLFDGSPKNREEVICFVSNRPQDQQFITIARNTAPEIIRRLQEDNKLMKEALKTIIEMEDSHEETWAVADEALFNIRFNKEKNR